jgi:hypothetical protein
VCIGSLARSAAYYANLRDCAPSNEGNVLSRLSRWWRLRTSRPSLSQFAAWARRNLKSSAAVLHDFRLNKNDRGQSSPGLNSRKSALMERPLLAQGGHSLICPSPLSANSRSRPYSISSSARAGSASGLRYQLPRKPRPRRSISCTSTTSVAGAILVNAPTLGKWYLLQGPAVTISRTTGIYALLISGLSRREDEIGVACMECSRTR